MIAFLCSIGERTTEICRWQLERLGFEVIVLDEVEPWLVKYLRFIDMANEDCIRIDADVIVNDKLLLEIDQIPKEMLMAQFQGFDFYKNEVGICSPCFYTKEALEIIRINFDKLDERRPEATAWRLKDINDLTWTGERVIGMHGFFQDKETIKRAKKNKADRKQDSLYDWELCDKIINELKK